VIEKKITIDFHYKGKLIIIKNVPVKVCEECKERYYDAHIWEELERIARSRTNVKKEIKVPVKEYELERI
jgi:YgiT-type zinc finger domain-containing protein